jgi:DNA-binding MarR family transcriptional regulator
MEPKEIKTLLLLEAVGKDECQSQRELSKRIRMSLGLVNTLIKRLTIRGIFETVNMPGNKVKYRLTPKGIAEKASLTKQYLSHSIHYYNGIKQIVSGVLSALKKANRENIVFYGTGELCEITCIAMNEHNIRNIRIIDDNKAGLTICGYRIQKSDQIDQLDFDAIVIMDFDDRSNSHKNLIDKGIPPEKIYRIFSPKDTNTINKREKCNLSI